MQGNLENAVFTFVASEIQETGLDVKQANLFCLPYHHYLRSHHVNIVP